MAADVKINKKNFLKANYEVTIREDGSESDPAFYATCDQLRGLNGWGKTPGEAYEDLRENMRDWYDAATKNQIPIPPPKGKNQRQFSGTFTLRIDPTLHATLANNAAEQAMSMNSFCETILRNAVLVKRSAAGQRRAKLADRVRRS